jgi:hypothetical protein
MAEQNQVSFQRGDDTTLLVRFSGAWRLRGGFPSASLVDRELRSAAQIDIDLIIQFTLAGQPSYLKSLRVDGHLSSD